MYKKILIANRGEIAVRIIKCCREMGIMTVAVYSTADRDSLHVKLADQAICIGTGKPIDSYLNQEKIINVAFLTSVDAIHPGYGFLSENSDFVRICEKLGIGFIGPSADTINLMGDKITAKQTMKEAKVAVLPGSSGIVHSIKEANIVAKRIGFPLLIKATSGGGGKGMKIVNTLDELDKAFIQTQNEAKVIFNDGDVYIEKFLKNPKHIEMQVLGDGNGNGVVLFDRECSIQRRNQKIIEEAPSPSIDDKTRKALIKDALKAVKHIKYLGAGTLEYVFDGTNFYFIEMNTRIQVEHPITEMITGIDLVRSQIQVCYHRKLPFSEKNIVMKGHAIEARINAEDPLHNFAPTPGMIDKLVLPSGLGIRNETYVYAGYKVPSNYDSLILKIIAYDDDRTSAIKKMAVALDDTQISPLITNINFVKKVISHQEFIKGTYNTSFVEKYLDEIIGEN